MEVRPLSVYFYIKQVMVVAPLQQGKNRKSNEEFFDSITAVQVTRMGT